MRTLLLILLLVPMMSFGQLKPHKEFFEGTLIEEGFYNENNLKEGVWRRYSESERHRGALREVSTYVNGKLNGPYIEYRGNGIKEREVNYKNDRYNGIYKSYYKNGNLMIEKNYKESKLVGPFKVYSKSGNVKCEGFADENKGSFDICEPDEEKKIDPHLR